ncbi:MAG: response regulator [Proteobacteria bacterium]|nr:response regulator [Pseudomonadota bacterium]
MVLKYKHTLLFVDDEESITKSLQRTFRKEGYEIHTALGGQEGLDLIKEAGKPFSLIISDQRMPGMTGAQFLEKARKILPHAMRILLTGYSDMDAIIDAVNKGEIHKYMTKPWNDEDIVLQVRHVLEQYELIVENRRLLALTKKQNRELAELNKHLEEKVAERTREITEKNEKLSLLNEELESNLYNTVKVFSSLIETEVQSSSLVGHARRVGMLSREIAQRFDLSEREVNHIEIAALLHDIGKVGLSQEILESNYKDLSPQDKKLILKHPEQGQATVQFIKNLDYVGIIIRSHHERYDGRGYPDHLTGEEIPLGARIIAVADAYDRIVDLGIDIDDSIKEIKIKREGLKKDEIHKQAAITHLNQKSLKRYDPDVVKIFLELLKGKGIAYEEKSLSLEELEEGMVLAWPLYSSRGRFVLPNNTILTEDHISKLKELHKNDPIDEKIYVVMKR